MTLWLILKYIVAIVTAGTGVFSLFAPTAIYGFTGLSANGARGISEIRSIFGGLFIALGVAPFFLGKPGWQMLGLGYAAIAVVRLVSIFLDKSTDQSNLVSLAIEVVFAILLLIKN
jgi:hypothetical protein